MLSAPRKWPRNGDGGDEEDNHDSVTRVVEPSDQDAIVLEELYQTLSCIRDDNEAAIVEDQLGPDHSPLHKEFTEFLQKEKKARPLRRLAVRFDDVTTWGLGGDAVSVKTFLDAVVRTAMLRDIYEWTIKPWLKKPTRSDARPIIRNISGAVRDGEMLLYVTRELSRVSVSNCFRVLGRPGSGCSTFLKTVTSHHKEYLAVDGSIDYSGMSPQQIVSKYRGDVTYIGEDDIHFPTMTVRQTLEFAYYSKTPKRCHADVPRYIEMLARVFGISHVLDTKVGNEHVRGVSGGERKRVSIIETLATDSAVIAWDGSTRGLDAAATVDYARSLRILTDVSRKATIVSLYQVSEEVYNYMDKVLVLDEGRMIFQGPISVAKAYFEELGYHCSERRTTADFLTSITSPDERRFRPGMEHKTPKGAIELERAFRESAHYKALQFDMNDGIACLSDSTATLVDFKKTTQAQKSRYVHKNSNYTVSYPAQVIMCVKRQYWQLKGNKEAIILRMINTLVNAFLIGSLFYNQPATTEGAFSRGGFLLYAVIFLGWIQIAELEECFNGREVVARHKNFAFCRPSAVGLARVVLDLPLIFIQNVLFCVVTYFLAGLQTTPGAFFTYFLFIFVTTIALTALYRMFAAISPNYEVAIRYCGLTLLIYIVFGGYVLSLDSLMSDAPWFGWLVVCFP